MINAPAGTYEASKQAAQIEALARRSETSDESELRSVCEDFETLFVKMMLDAMRDTLEDNSLIPKNAGEKMFEDELFEEYARKIGRTADLGIADMMYKQMAQGLPGSLVDLQSS